MWESTSGSHVVAHGVTWGGWRQEKVRTWWGNPQEGPYCVSHGVTWGGWRQKRGPTLWDCNISSNYASGSDFVSRGGG